MCMCLDVLSSSHHMTEPDFRPFSALVLLPMIYFLQNGLIQIVDQCLMSEASSLMHVNATTNQCRTHNVDM